MKEPIDIFENQEQLNNCLKEWQERLFLNDWIIKAQFGETNENNHGENEFKFSIKCSIITILRPLPQNEWIAKQPEELVLIHELLHLKMNLVNGMESYEGVWLQQTQHQLLEEIAKSLLMAKYNLKFSWFYPEVKS